MGALLQDLRYGVRLLVKDGGFTAVAMLSLALGIGATTAVFSMVNAVLLQPLPYKEPDRLVSITGNKQEMNIREMTASLPDLEDWRNQSRLFEDFASYYGWIVNLTGDGEPERIQGARISANLFS